MLAIIQFFIDNYVAIIILSISIIGILTVFSMFNNKFNDINGAHYDKDVKKVVTIETLENSTDDLPNQSFSETAHESIKHDHPKRHEFCKNSHPKVCAASSSCIMLNGNECVAGDRQGPIYLTREANSKTPVHVEYYHYKNKCFKGRGACP